MPTYTRLKQEIAGVRAVADSVKATEEVSASRIHRLRKVSYASRDYIEDLRRILEAFSPHYGLGGGRFFRNSPSGHRLLIVLGFDRGLTGGLDNRMLDAVLRSVERFDELVSVGERMTGLLQSEGLEPRESFPTPSDKVSDEESSAIQQSAIEAFITGRCRTVDVLYPAFETLAVQAPRFARFLPLTPGSFEAEADVDDTVGATVIMPLAPTDSTKQDGPSAIGLPLFLPSPAEVAESLVRTYLNVYFRSRLTESKLSELAARTVACEHAATQAEDQVRQMTLNFFKERRRELSRRQIESFFAHQVTAA